MGIENDIFHPHQRSIRNQSIEGTRLDLPLSKKIFEQHSGTIRVRLPKFLSVGRFEFKMPLAKVSSKEKDFH